MSSGQIAIIVIAVVLLAVLAVVAWMAWRRRSLRQRFGPEYDRVVSEQDSRSAAERELRERERRHAELELRPLDANSRERYASAWKEIQGEFVDAPDAAINDADELVTRLVAERGYPTENYEDQLAHLSVEHARTLGHYRDAHDVYLRHQRGEATTEQLRQALVHYRELFADLLGEDPLDQTGDGRVRSDDAPVEAEESQVRSNGGRAASDVSPDATHR
jgi:hypothetical protein